MVLICCRTRQRARKLYLKVAQMRKHRCPDAFFNIMLFFSTLQARQQISLAESLHWSSNYVNVPCKVTDVAQIDPTHQTDLQPSYQAPLLCKTKLLSRVL